MHIVRNSLPCGLGCSGGRWSETLPFTPVWLLLLNLHPRFNFSFGRPCSPGLLLPTAAGDKRRMEINGMEIPISKAVYLIYCKSHTVCRLQLSNMNMQIGFWLLCRSEMQEVCFFVLLISVRAGIKVALKLKGTSTWNKKLKITTSSSASIAEQTKCFRLFGWSIFNLWGSFFVHLNQEMFPEKCFLLHSYGWLCPRQNRKNVK